LQDTEALCHLSVTDIKKTFCNVWFFCKNEACVNCGTLNATTLIRLLTAEWIWDRSIFSIIKPSYCFRISENLQHMNATLFLLLFLNSKNNFALKSCKCLANLCKSSEILEQCHVKWWLKYRNNKSVSWRLSCIGAK
jgi:hypothetical protein